MIDLAGSLATTRPRSNAAVGPGMAPEFDGTVVVRFRRGESEGVLSLQLGRAAGEPLPGWEPGAHIDLVLPSGLTRQYSLCGRVSDRDTWRVGVLREPVGRGGSAWIHDHAQVGTELRVRGPRNNFPLRSGPSTMLCAWRVPARHRAPAHAADQARPICW